MRTSMKKAGYAAVAAAAVTALTAGLTAAPAAPGASSDGGGGSPGYAQQAGVWVTLITGDRVRVDGEGRAVAVEPGPGREGMHIRAYESGGHSFVVPGDATGLVADGTLDRRLFDVTLQARKDYVRHQRDGLKLIVGYRGDQPEARTKLHAADGTEVQHRFPRLNAEALTTGWGAAPRVWETLTDPGRGPQRAVESGVERVWLDGLRHASLDTSVPQIGAPAAWEAGYDGSGVKIAVLDTGVDETHPDLAGQVVASENFSSAADDEDRRGHGTHVASIAAGTGAASPGGDGAFTGVAPGARLLSGKVLNDEGAGSESGILAGFEWAVEQDADIVNLSLGGEESPGVDPLEEGVNRISADEGVLFAVAAGNGGELGPYSLDSPGSADAALTVGAVDDRGELADFSSRGPRLVDNAVKPDVTAPGVGITAAAAPGSDIAQEVGQDPEGYMTINGTSMSTPHVAGAAALLAQRHPDWTGQQLKAALVGSAKPAPGEGAYGQGAGLIAVDRALGQTVVAEPVSLNFGKQLWPHQDDDPVTKSLTYRNLGDEDVTLNLSVSGVRPDGDPAPAGMFTLGADTVTVPAGGTAEVPVTVDTRPGGDLNGMYAVHVTGTGDGQRVVTAGGVEREEAMYELTVNFLGRDGQPAADGEALLAGVNKGYYTVFEELVPENGTATVRVPKGPYSLDAGVTEYDGDRLTALDKVSRPRLDLTADTEITIDARTAKPVDITVPDEDAVPGRGVMTMDIEPGEGQWPSAWYVPSFENVRTAHLGPEVAPGEVYQGLSADFHNDDKWYKLDYGTRDRTTMWTGLTRHVARDQLAEIPFTLGSSVPGKEGHLVPFSNLAFGPVPVLTRELPYTGTLYALAGGNRQWTLEFTQFSDDGLDMGYRVPARGYAGGRTYEQSFNVGVVGPALPAEQPGELVGIERDGDTISTTLPIYLDSGEHTGFSAYDTAKTTLYRDGEEVASLDDLPIYQEFRVPAGAGAYELTATTTRPTVARTSTEVSARWTFTSGETAGPERLPASVVRFAPELAPDSTAEAGRTLQVPVTVQGSGAGGNLKSLAVWASTDRGAHWKKVPVRGGEVAVATPAAGKTVSFKAKAVDKQGNTVTQTILDAYGAR
ncbi:S8 family serine peptidase [Streptomyces sp. WMMC500]|uniref:S8 family peptidase n=1 Tax=Streptomyces sp. WMMC500 TaxID=3015154 RepID=UPI00248AA658|nr:S8 family serine peptidase [Streptomyces sp. WMMC500]WBB63548.1 S8 family serine peptidase [Streptomyces sp. WMMC500]